MGKNIETCQSCIFRLRFGFSRSLYEQLFLANAVLVMFVTKLGIKGQADVARMMKVFLNVDVRGTHVIDIETFFESFGIEFTEYNQRAFRILAFGEQGLRRKVPEPSLKFDQFFISMYNYGTLVHESLVRFAFDVMSCGKEWCDRRDVLGLVSLLHSDANRTKETMASVMSIMDPFNRDKISFDTFRKEEKRLGSMLFPAFKLQKILRSKVLGQWFWRRATRKRCKARLTGGDLRQEYYKIKEEHARQLETQSGRRESHRESKKTSEIGPNTGGAGNVQRHDEQSQARVTFDSKEGDQPPGELSDAASSASTTDVSDGCEGEIQREMRRVSWVEGRESRTRKSSVSADPSKPDLQGPTLVVSEDHPVDRRRSRSQVEHAMARRSSSANAKVHSNQVSRRSSNLRASAKSRGERRRSSIGSLGPSVAGRRGSMFQDMQVFEPSQAENLPLRSTSLGRVSSAPSSGTAARRKSNVSRVSRPSVEQRRKRESTEVGGATTDRFDVDRVVDRKRGPHAEAGD